MSEKALSKTADGMVNTGRASDSLTGISQKLVSLQDRDLQRNVDPDGQSEDNLSWRI